MSSRRFAARPLGSSRGFSLPEVIVVSAILALLFTLLVPSLSASRKRAKATYCLNNLNEMGHSLATYGADYQERLPPAVIDWHPTQVERLQSGTNPCQLVGYGWAEMLYEHVLPNETVTDWAHFPVQRNFDGKYTGLFTCPEAELAEDHSGHYRVYLPAWANEVYPVDQHGRIALTSSSPYSLSPRMSNLKAKLPLIGDANEFSNRGDYLGNLVMDGCQSAGCPVAETSVIGLAVSPAHERFNEANQQLDFCGDGEQSINSFSHRHANTANYLFGDLHAESDGKLRERLACDWDLNGVEDPLSPGAREWSGCPRN